jgi:spoIIIJ-associated protein
MGGQEFEGKDLEEALHNASSALDVSEEELHYEIVEQGRRGVFGLGVRSVRIRIMPPVADLGDDEILTPGQGASEGARARPVPRVRGAGASEAVRAAAPEIERSLQRVLDLMGLGLHAHSAVEDDGIAIELEGDDLEMLLDRNAELLSALRLVVNRMARRAWPDVGRIRIACDGCAPSGRDDEIVQLAREVAQRVARTGRTQRLQPLNAYERRLVHLTVREFGGLSSTSDGNGSLKRVKISKVRANTLRQ